MKTTQQGEDPRKIGEIVYLLTSAGGKFQPLIRLGRFQVELLNTLFQQARYQPSVHRFRRVSVPIQDDIHFFGDRRGLVWLVHGLGLKELSR